MEWILVHSVMSKPGTNEDSKKSAGMRMQSTTVERKQNKILPNMTVSTILSIRSLH